MTTPIIKELAHMGPKYRDLIEGGGVVVYETDTPLPADGTFATACIRNHVYDVLEADEFIEWGPARFLQIDIVTDQDSADPGLYVEYTTDGEGAAGSIVPDFQILKGEDSVQSFLFPKRGIGFRVTYVNGEIAQELFSLKATAYKKWPNDPNVPMSDASGTITEGGTDQVALASGYASAYLSIANPVGDPESGTVIYYAFGEAAAVDTAGSRVLIPGAERIWEGENVPSEEIHVISADTSAPYTVKYR